MFQPWLKAWCWIQPLWMRPIWALFQTASTWHRTFGPCAFVTWGTPAEISCAFATVGQGAPWPMFGWMPLTPITKHLVTWPTQFIYERYFQKLGTFETSSKNREDFIILIFVRVGTCRQSLWEGLAGVSQVEGAFEFSVRSNWRTFASAAHKPLPLYQPSCLDYRSWAWDLCDTISTVPKRAAPWMQTELQFLYTIYDWHAQLVGSCMHHWCAVRSANGMLQGAKDQHYQRIGLWSTNRYPALASPDDPASWPNWISWSHMKCNHASTHLTSMKIDWG